MQRRYTVQAPDGRTVTLEGPDGASQEDVIAQAQRLLGGPTAAPKSLTPAQVAARKSELEASGRIDKTLNPGGVGTFGGSLIPEALATGKTALGVGKDLVAGVGSGVMSTGLGASKLLNQATGGRVGVPKTTTLSDIGMQPENTAQKVGMVGEQFGEFLIPAGAVAKGAKFVEGATAGMRGARLLSGAGRAALEGLGAGGVATLQTGDPEVGAKTGAVTGAISGALPIIGGVAKKLLPSQRLNPVQQKALDIANAEGLPIDLATATQSKPIQYARAMTDITPIVSRHGAEFTEKLDKGVTEAIGRFTSGITKAEAGTSVRESLSKVTAKLHEQANKAYSAMRARIPESSHVVGTKTVASPILGPDGLPAAASTVDVVKKIAGVTDISRVRAAASKIVSEIESEIPMAQRDASPGLFALRQIAKLDDLEDFVTAESALSQLKAVVRDAKSFRFQDIPSLRSRSQGIAASVIKPLSDSIESAAAKHGVSDLLAAGRIATREKWAVADLLNQLNPREPVVAFDYLMKNGDHSIATLKRVIASAPETKEAIAEATIQGLLEKSTQGGNFAADGAVAAWNRLGAMTKKELFGAKAETIEGILNYAKMAKRDMNPSGSGRLIGFGALTGAGLVTKPLATAGTYVGLEAAAQAIYKHPEAALKAMKADFGKAASVVKAGASLAVTQKGKTNGQ